MKISPFVLILTVFSVFAQADDFPVSGPRFDDAKYVVKAFTSEGSERTVIIKRTGPYFSTFIKQKYDCSNSEFRYIGAGLKSEEITDEKTDSQWLRLSPADWYMEVKNYVCLSNENKTASSGM